MRAISLWQPYASLIAIGAKTIETRSWGTNWRGPILIHAAKKWSKDVAVDCVLARDILLRANFKPATKAQCTLAEIPWKESLGVVVCKAKLIDCKPMLEAPGDALNAEFGTFGEGRYGWFLDEIEPVLPPVPYRGRRQLFDIPWPLLTGRTA